MDIRGVIYSTKCRRNNINLKTLYSIENKVLKLGGGRSTQDVYAEIRRGNSERWTIQSQKRKYVNGKLSGVIEVGYSASINTPDNVLEEDKSNNEIQITAQYDGTSGTCVLTQNESGNKINLHLTTPEEKQYWEIRFNPLILYGVDTNSFLLLLPILMAKVDLWLMVTHIRIG